MTGVVVNSGGRDSGRPGKMRKFVDWEQTNPKLPSQPKAVGIGLRQIWAFVLSFASVQIAFCEKIASSVARLGLRSRPQTDLITLILYFIDSSSTWFGQPPPNRSDDLGLLA
jgi:hypothetical protein